MGKVAITASAIVLAGMAGIVGYFIGQAQTDFEVSAWKPMHLVSPPTGPSPALTPPRMSPDRKHALTAPVDELAQAAFGAAAGHFVEVERPTFTGMSGPEAPLDGLRFATKARPAGDYGLCEATTAWLNATKVEYAGNGPITTRTLYKVVSSTKPIEAWNEAYAASMAGRCAKAGRVLPTESANFGEVGFADIEYPPDLRPWFAARSVEVALEVFRKTPLQVPCQSTKPSDGLAGSCIMAALPSSSLRMDRLTSIAMQRGCGGGSKNCYTVTAEFLRSANFNDQNVWTLSFQAYMVGTQDDISRADTLKVLFGTRIID